MLPSSMAGYLNAVYLFFGGLFSKAVKDKLMSPFGQALCHLFCGEFTAPHYIRIINFSKYKYFHVLPL